MNSDVRRVVGEEGTVAFEAGNMKRDGWAVVWGDGDVAGDANDTGLDNGAVV